MKKGITRLFCLVDDFLKALEEERKKKQIEDGKKPRKPTRTPGLTESEIATIVLMFLESPCRNFKYFYKSYLQQYKPEFPKMPTYERFAALMPRTLYFLTLLFCCTLREKKERFSKELFLHLMARELKIITGIKCSMKNILMSFEEKILLRKRSLVETVLDYLKNKFMLEHSRHRSFINMLVHIISTLTAYQLKSTKPSFSSQLLPLSNP